LIDNKGKLIDQGSLNIAFYDKDENPRTIEKTKYTWNQKQKKWDENTVQCWDYNDLLDCEASHRDWARKNWQTIGKIRNLKEGYLSQVIHEITKKIINNSDKLIFIVLEDLNSGFKRSRQKIEKQIYQKFETALAKKLNFIVDKDKTRESFLSPIRAVQLTPPVINYQDIGDEKQVGILLYTRANYTSVTDPNTGWRKTVYLKRGKQSDIKDQILKTFDDFGFDGKDYFFEYTNKNTNKKWRLWSGKEGESLPRYRGKRGREKYEWKIEKIDVVKKLNNLFAGLTKVDR
jgi:CRISPR-associated protein Cpf1